MPTILIVDDEPEIIRIARGYLEQAGFRVVGVGNGRDALAAFRHEQPDLVILDLNLPAPAGSPPLDGLDVARAFNYPHLFRLRQRRVQQTALGHWHDLIVRTVDQQHRFARTPHVVFQLHTVHFGLFHCFLLSEVVD